MKERVGVMETVTWKHTLPYVKQIAKNHVKRCSALLIIGKNVNENYQCGIASHQSECPSAKNLQTINVGGNVDKQ